MFAKRTMIKFVWVLAFSVVIFRHAQMQFSSGLSRGAATGGIRRTRGAVGDEDPRYSRKTSVGDDDSRYGSGMKKAWPGVADQDRQSSSARLDAAVQVAPNAGFGWASNVASSNVGYTVALPATDDSARRLSGSDISDFPSNFKMAGVIIGALVAAVIPGNVLKSYSYYAAAHPQPPAQVAAVQTDAVPSAIEKRSEATKLKTPTVEQNKTPVTAPMTTTNADLASSYPQHVEQWRPAAVRTRASPVAKKLTTPTVDQSMTPVTAPITRAWLDSTLSDVLPSEAFETEKVANMTATTRVETQAKAALPASPPVPFDVVNSSLM